MHSLNQLKMMNDEAMEVYEAKKLGIVSPSRSLGTSLDVKELSLLRKAHGDTKQ